MGGNQILNLIFVVFALLGGIDYMLDNRFGLGEEFSRGIHAAGPLILCMISFMTLADWISMVLSPTLGPVLSKIGADPSLASIVLSIDSGGAVIAEKMALDPGAAILNGYIVAAMMGSAINGNIPLSVMAVDKERRKPVLFGLAMGIASIPVGSAVGGIIAGVSARVLIGNLIPLFVISVLLVGSLILFGDKMIGILKALSKLNVLICVVGLVITALGELAGIEILPSRMAFTEIMVIIGRIVLTLCGMFPLMGLILRFLKKPLGKAADRLGVTFLDLKCIPISMINCFSTIDQLKDMSDLGIAMNCAFGIGAGYALGDHLAYTSAVAPELSAPVIIAKLIAGIVSVVLVFAFFRKIQKQKTSENRV